MATVQKITPHLWFAHEAEEAATFYTGIFKNSKIGKISHYAEAGKEIHKMNAGSVMTVEFWIEGQAFLALNGGPLFKFNESISFMIKCKDQEEIDYYWEKLNEGGDIRSQQCGWLKDKFGLSWQVVPEMLSELLSGGDRERINRVVNSFMQMKKIDIAGLEKAAKG